MPRCLSRAMLTALILCPALPAAGPEQPVEVPYRLTIPKHVLVRVKINGKGPFNFILDTGAPALFVAVPVAKKAGLKGDENQWGTIDRFEVEGGVMLENVKARVETPFQLEGMNGLGLAGAEIHGLIGYSILAKYRMTIDLTRDKMTWTPLSYKPNAPAGMGGKGGAPGGLDMMGGVMKTLGTFLGRKPSPPPTFRGFLGLTLADGDPPTVTAVLPAGPAARAGVKVGDQVTKVNGRTVTNLDDALKRAGKVAPGGKIKLTVSRATTTTEIEFATGEGI